MKEVKLMGRWIPVGETRNAEALRFTEVSIF